MNDKNSAQQMGNEQPLKRDDTTVQPETNSPNTPQQGKVNNIDDNTKLENDSDSGDLNDDD